jgi:hypothetical protein
MSTTSVRPSYPEVSSSDTHSRINNGDRCNHCFQRSNTPSVTLRSPKFKGKFNDLKGHIYDCTSAKQINKQSKPRKLLNIMDFPSNLAWILNSQLKIWK